MALTDNVSFPWFAPAGFNRGLADVIRAQLRLTQLDRDTLYESNINPIATFTQQGVVIYGQKTLQQAQSALDRINVRRLLLQIRRVVAAASQTLLFEQNDTTLQDQFKAKVEPILLQIQNNRGLYGFRVIMDETNNTPETMDRNTLVGKIQLKPTRTAEYIDLTFQVLPTGANFTEF
jgi:phage tail sheath protein FI